MYGAVKRSPAPCSDMNLNNLLWGSKRACRMQGTRYIHGDAKGRAAGRRSRPSASSGTSRKARKGDWVFGLRPVRYDTVSPPEICFTPPPPPPPPPNREWPSTPSQSASRPLSQLWVISTPTTTTILLSTGMPCRRVAYPKTIIMTMTMTMISPSRMSEPHSLSIDSPDERYAYALMLCVVGCSFRRAGYL